MKVEAVTGTGACAGTNTGINFATPTIENNYTNFSKIPSGYTKIATLPSVTDIINSISIKTSYAVYTSTSQGVGTYTGKVKYTVVYPASNLPVGPVTTTANKISYNPNTNGVVDSMGDQSISSTTTSVELWASNFKRKGYGFAGWSDKWDWELNQNDASGNGTGANAGYHIYGPNETITITAGQYSGENQSLSLYAVWVPSEGTLQNWNGCQSMTIGQVTALTNNRDNNTYAVAKLADDNCWMAENLRLDDTAELTTENTDNPNLPLILSDGTTANHLSTCDCYYGYNDRSLVSVDNTRNSVNNMTNKNQNIYSYGNSYNAYSAGVGHMTYSLGRNKVGTICPKGWRMPIGGAHGEFKDLHLALNSDNNKWFKFPINMLNAEALWSSSGGANDGGDLFRVGYFTDDDYETGMYGVRCMFYEKRTIEQSYAVAGKEKYNGYYKMQDMTSEICKKTTIRNEVGQTQVIDIRDNKLYWITRLQDGQCWMTQNLDLNLNKNVTYTHDDTDLGWGNDLTKTSWRPSNSTINVTNITNNSYSGWSSSKDVPNSVDPGNVYWTDVWHSSIENNFLNNDFGSNPVKWRKDTPFASNSTHGHVGNYYNWIAATAGDKPNYSHTAQNSICPAGWRLPVGDDDFHYLRYYYGRNTMYSSDETMVSAPLYLVRSGFVAPDQRYASSKGLYWGSKVYGTSNDMAYSLSISSSEVDTRNYDSGYAGYSIRCVAR